MAHTVSRLAIKILTVAVGIPVGILTKKVLGRTRTAVRPDGKPRKDAKGRDQILDIAGFAALTAAAAVTAKTLSRRGGEKAWTAITGLEPPPPPLSKAQKKAAKKARKQETTATG